MSLVSADDSNSLIQRSNLKGKTIEKPKPKLSSPPKVQRVYANKKVPKIAWDTDSDENNETKTCIGTEATEPSFIHPADCGVDFEEIRALLKKRESTLKTSLSTSSFESPDSIIGTANVYGGETCFEQPPEFNLSFLYPTERTCKFCRKKIPADFTEDPPTVARARLGYCQRHENASILHDGRAQGFPTAFDFIEVKSRIIRLIPKVRKIISRRKESEFLINIRAKTSRRNAAAPMTMIALFEEAQPGYYGPRGSELISEIVMKRLGDKIRKKENLLESLKFCGGVMGYISAVIVPEVGTLLIMEDMGVERAEAKKVMRESVTYGNVVNPSLDGVSSDEEDGNEDSDLDSD